MKSTRAWVRCGSHYKKNLNDLLSEITAFAFYNVGDDDDGDDDDNSISQ